MTKVPRLTERLSLEGRHALVCGASAGIGLATARTLAGLGATLSILSRSRARLDSLCPELRELGAPQVHVLEADLQDVATLHEKIAPVLQAHGPLHILIHNTGGPPGGALVQAHAADLQKAFERHVLSAHTLVRCLLPGMRQAGYGRIVNVLSTSVREPIPNLGVSNTIRAAMAGWAKTLSGELPAGVTINNVLPGFTATQRLASLAQQTAERSGTRAEDVVANWIQGIPEGRLGEAHEVAAVIAFLATPAAAYVRGQSIAADGGRLRSI